VDDEILQKAQDALRMAPLTGDPVYLDFPAILYDQLAKHWPQIQKANRDDIAGVMRRRSPALAERLRLGPAHLRELAALTSMVARELSELRSPAPLRPYRGMLTVRRVAKPLGVIFMIYEGRPTVTVEGALLPIVMGNSVILRGGHEIARTNAALAVAVDGALEKCALPAGMAQVIEDGDRSRLRALIRSDDQIDVVIARGSPSLLDYCRRASAIPIIASGGGVNHMYVHRSADLGLAVECVLDSKLADPAGCTALEMVLADDIIAGELIDALASRSRSSGARAFTLCLPPEFAERLSGTGQIGVRTISERDNGREFLDETIALRTVPGLAGAVEHIRAYGSMHTEGIVASIPAVIADFCRLIDAATVVVNGSLRLHDGPAMGLGAELAISTGRLHVRGPVTLESLATYSWVVEAHNGAYPQLVP